MDEKEAKIRQDAHRQAWQELILSLVDSYVLSRGEIAVLKSRLEKDQGGDKH